jgi:hypothetical protein
MNHFNIQRAFQTMKNRDWDKLYWMIDLHDTVFKGDYKADSVGGEFYPKAKEVLQRLSNRKDVVLIVWTCSYAPIINQTMEWLRSHGIVFQYANENPECPSIKHADFTHKFYFNIVLDDKAGFEGETDWYLVEAELNLIDNGEGR